VWALDVLGLLERERTLRGAEHKCIDRLRGAGVIR